MDKTVVVTGGTMGIGLATAEHLARTGYNVAVIARDQSRLDAVQARLSAFGNKVLTISADVADATAVDAAAERIERELGSIDAWVNNAMSAIIARADEVTPEEYQRVTATTYFSQVYGTLAALRYMKPRRRGTIVQVSSGLGYRAIPMQAPYCAAKFAVSGFTDSLRAELLADDVPISLSVVYLPAVNTPQPQMARNRSGYEQVLPDPLHDPRLCAEAIAHLIEHPQREMWVGRSNVKMALTQRIAPGVADRQVGDMIENQRGKPAPDKKGNLFEPVPGPAVIDGNDVDRMIGTRSQFYTSSQRDLLKFGIGAGLVGVGAALATGLFKLKHRPGA